MDLKRCPFCGGFVRQISNDFCQHEENDCWVHGLAMPIDEWNRRATGGVEPNAPQQPQPATAPLVVCLCGSTRFFKEFMLANFNETMAGRIVLSVGFYPHSSEQAHGEHIGISVADKLKLDDLHKRKIDLCNEVLVINVGGYIGESTRSEISYATALGKRIRYLEPQQA